MFVLIVPFKNLIRMFHIDHLACKEDSFNSCLPICIAPICLLHRFYYIIYFLLLPFIVANTLITKSTKSDKSKYPCVKSIQPLTIKYLVRLRFFKVHFVMLWQYVLLLVFIMNVCWILSNHFCSCIEINIYFFKFSLILWFTLIDFQMPNLWNPMQYCIWGIKTNWTQCITFFINC